MKTPKDFPEVVKEEEITLKKYEGSDMWTITYEPLNLTTQGEDIFHALLMLADAIAAHEDSDIDLMEVSEDVFIPDKEMIELFEEISKD